MKVLVMLPLSGEIIAPFTRPFVPGFIAGFHSTIARLKAFGEVAPQIKLDIVDLAASESSTLGGVDKLTNAASEACKNFDLSGYSALVSGTSPVSNKLYSCQSEILKRFTGSHFLVSFDKDIVRHNQGSAIRLIPHYGLEFTSFTDFISRENCSNCLFVSVSDDASEMLFDHLSKISPICHKGNIRLEKLMLHWELDKWPDDGEIVATLSKFEYIIIAVYSYQLEKLASLMLHLKGSKTVFVNLDGIDLVGSDDRTAISRFVDKFSPLTHAPPWTLRGCSVYNYRASEQDEVTISFYDSKGDELDGRKYTPVDEDAAALLKKYVAGYAFDTASILVLSEQKRTTNSDSPARSILTKDDVISTLPFQGITGTLAVDEAGDLSVPLRLAKLQVSDGKLGLDAIEPTLAEQSGSTISGKHHPSISALVKAFVGSSLVPTRQVCFLDVAYNDHQADRDKIHWVVAAPSVITITEYKKFIMDFGGRREGYRLGNHPSVLALLPRLVNRRAINLDELKLIEGSRVPVYRIPQDAAELADFRNFIRSSESHTANWSVELVDYLTSILPPQKIFESGKAELERQFPEFPGLVAVESTDLYSDFAGLPSDTAPPLMELWNHLSEGLRDKRDKVCCFKSCSGAPLRRIYLCTIHFDPREEDTVSGYPSENITLSNYRLAQVYLGIGWNSDDPDGTDKTRAEQEALTLLDSIRAFLLEHATIERLQTWQRRIGVEDTVDVLGHQFKKLPLAVSGKHPNWLCTRETFDTLEREGQIDLSNYLIAPRPALLDAFGRLLTFWSFDNDPRALFLDRVPGSLIEVTEFAARFASQCELARHFSQRALNDSKDFDDIDTFPILRVTVAKESESLSIDTTKFHINGRPSLGEENKDKWVTLAGLIRLLVVFCEGAIQYRKEPHLFTLASLHSDTISDLNLQVADKLLLNAFKSNNRPLTAFRIRLVSPGAEWKISQDKQSYFVRNEGGKLNIYDGTTAEVQLCIARNLVRPSEISVRLKNTCLPKEERRRRTDSRMGMKGDHIKLFIRSKFLSHINAEIIEPVDNGDTYEAEFRFSECDWMY